MSGLYDVEMEAKTALEVVRWPHIDPLRILALIECVKTADAYAKADQAFLESDDGIGLIPESRRICDLREAYFEARSKLEKT